MRIEIEDGHTVAEVRRMLRRNGGAHRVTVRNGKIYTMVYNPGRQPQTVFQRSAQEILARATRLAARDMCDNGVKYRWQKRARRLGYKSAYGAAKAYYIKALKKRMLKKVEEKWEVVENRLTATSAGYTELVRNVIVLSSVLRMCKSEAKKQKDNKKRWRTAYKTADSG